jgi:hypothetical protein
MIYDVTVKFFNGYHSFQVEAESFREAEAIAMREAHYPSERNAQWMSIETSEQNNQNKLL